MALPEQPDFIGVIQIQGHRLSVRRGSGLQRPKVAGRSVLTGSLQRQARGDPVRLPNPPIVEQVVGFRVVASRFRQPRTSGLGPCQGPATRRVPAVSCRSGA